MQTYEEIWKDIPNYEGHYQASNLGRVKSFKIGKERVLKGKEDYDGYLLVNLWKNGRQETKKVHRLVMLAFVGESYLQVNHKNGIKSDNRLENLEYCTQSKNIRHAYANGLTKAIKGEKNVLSKLTDDQARKIKYEHKGMLQKDIAKIYGVSKSVVCFIRSGRSWKHI